jgi:hypothetical protein
MKIQFILLLLFLVSCNGGGGAGSAGGGEISVAPSSYSISLLNPLTTPSLDSTPTIIVSGLSPDESIGVYSDSGCSSLLVSGTATSSSVELTLPTLPVGETGLYVKGSGACSSVLLTYRYGLKLSGS